jgi:hypothetical protein
MRVVRGRARHAPARSTRTRRAAPSRNSQRWSLRSGRGPRAHRGIEGTRVRAHDVPRGRPACRPSSSTIRSRSTAGGSAGHSKASWPTARSTSSFTSAPGVSCAAFGSRGDEHAGWGRRTSTLALADGRDPFVRGAGGVRVMQAVTPRLQRRVHDGHGADVEAQGRLAIDAREDRERGPRALRWRIEQHVLGLVGRELEVLHREPERARRACFATYTCARPAGSARNPEAALRIRRRRSA